MIPTLVQERIIYYVITLKCYRNIKDWY